MKVRTDLALEAREMINEKKTGALKEVGELPGGIIMDTKDKPNVTITRITVETDEAAQAINKKKGRYVTIELKNGELNTMEVYQEVAKTLCDELQEFMPSKNPNIMIAGLGNWKVTPDSLGPKVVEKLVVTRHIKDTMPEEALDPRLGNVCAVAPGVLGITGIETGDLLQGVINRIKPDIIFAIDALASRKTSRINTTIQITDTGIVPGSGVGNKRMELSKDTLGIPVIAIGVPTVVEAITLAKDLLENASGEELEESLYVSISKTCGAEMVVTPKNIDIAIERMATTIANGLNMTIHKGFDFGDINDYMM